MSSQTGGKFRVKKNYFSMVSNNALRDPELSLRAKGLYSLIQSYITMDGFTLYKGFLEKQSKDSHNTFDSAWKELKNNGYLLQFKLRDENNRYVYEYELLDSPQPKNEGVEVLPQPKIPEVETPYSGNATYGDLGSINNTNNNKTVQTNTINNHIVTESDIIRQIGYEGYDSIDSVVQDIVFLLVEVMNTDNNALIRINKTDMKAQTVKERFKKIEFKHIEYIKLVLSDFTGDIRNIKSFMLTTIFNSVSTYNVYFQTRINRDFYEAN